MAKNDAKIEFSGVVCCIRDVGKLYLVLGTQLPIGVPIRIAQNDLEEGLLFCCNFTAPYLMMLPATFDSRQEVEVWFNSQRQNGASFSDRRRDL